MNFVFIDGVNAASFVRHVVEHVPEAKIATASSSHGSHSRFANKFVLGSGCDNELSLSAVLNMFIPTHT